PARPRATATRPACSPAPPLVHPHIIHPHRLREDGRRIRTARPVPTHGYVENDEKRGSYTHRPGRSLGVTVLYSASSTYQRIAAGSHSMAYTWKVSANAPAGRSYALLMPPAPEYPGPCTVPCMRPGSLPMFSMMSISPHVGQPAEGMLSPSSQNAGHSPCPRGI